MTTQHMHDLATPRRYATLLVGAIAIETTLTDATLLMFDKLIGSASRKAERKTADNGLETLRQAQGNLRTLTAACRALIDARAGKADPFAAIERLVGTVKANEYRSFSASNLAERVGDS